MIKGARKPDDLSGRREEAYNLTCDKIQEGV